MKKCRKFNVAPGAMRGMLALVILLSGCAADESTHSGEKPLTSVSVRSGYLQDAPQDLSAPPDSAIRAQLEMIVHDDPQLLRGVEHDVLERVDSFYIHNNYQGVWFEGGQITAAGKELYQRLDQADRHGLQPMNYRYRMLGNWSLIEQSARSLAQHDAQLTASFMEYARDMTLGMAADGNIKGEWTKENPDYDFSGMLLGAIRNNAVADTLDALVPDHAQYVGLQEKLSEYREIVDRGGWAPIPEGDVLRPGDSTTYARTITDRLAAAGFLPSTPPSDSVYTEHMAQSVFELQQAWGLDRDSLLGPETRAALNVPADERLKDIIVNLDRWRRVRDDLGERYIRVNIPSFELFAFEKGYETLHMGVILGATYNSRQTPIFLDRIRYIIFSPYWNIPYSIATEEILPKARNDRQYLMHKEYEIVDNYGPTGNVYDPTTANLEKIVSGDLLFRQKSGRSNALGGVKFMFPNRFAIYLHDTPAGNLFDQAARDFSHGCIRVENPARLAEWILSEQNGWSADRIRKEMWNGEWNRVQLDENIPVHIIYFTAQVDDDGRMAFFKDVYGLDDMYKSVLF